MSTTVKEKIVFIVNPISGGRNKSGFEEMVRKSLNLEFYEPVISYTEKPGHACDLAKAALQQNVRKIVAVGGDGTVNEVAKSIMNSEAALGIVPFGSGNGLARHMGIPVNPAKAIAHLNKASIRLNDAGVINGMPFFCTSGMGFDAHIGKIFATLKGRGFSGYIKAVLTEFANYKPQKYTLTVNGLKIDRSAFLITFANASQYGNNAYIAPQANVMDGKLDVCILKPFPVYSMPGLALRVFNKTADKSAFMEALKGTEITIERENEGPIHLDGEPYETGKEIKVGILPGCLKILV
jgi:YegS/Rv2252/BmrU family lipid kinase